MKMYKVKPYDTIYSICRDFGITTKEFFNANPKLYRQDALIYVGDYVNIPEHESKPETNTNTNTPEPNEKGEKKMIKKNGLVGAVILAVLLIAALIGTVTCLERIPAGYVGVVYSMNGGVDGEVLTQGWHIVPPTKKVTAYTIGMEQSGLTEGKTKDSHGNESFKVPTSDGKTVRVSLEFSYRFDPARITDTFIMFKGQSGEQIKDEFIKTKVMAWTQEVSANYPVTDIFGDKRTAINNELDIHLREKFDAYGIIIDTVNFTDIAVDDETAAAIQKKVTAQQELELASIEAQTAKVQAEKDKEIARIAAEKDKEVAAIQAEKTLITAEAKADALRIEAEAEAEANTMIAKSLTTELIDKIKYERWNGQMPVISGEVTPIVSLSDVVNKE